MSSYTGFSLVVAVLLGGVIWHWQRMYSIKHEIFRDSSKVLATIWELYRVRKETEDISLSNLVEKRIEITSVQFRTAAYFSDSVSERLNDLIMRFFEKKEDNKIQWQKDMKDLLLIMKEEITFVNILKQALKF